MPEPERGILKKHEWRMANDPAYRAANLSAPGGGEDDLAERVDALEAASGSVESGGDALDTLVIGTDIALPANATASPDPVPKIIRSGHVCVVTGRVLFGGSYSGEWLTLLVDNADFLPVMSLTLGNTYVYPNGDGTFTIEFFREANNFGDLYGFWIADAGPPA